MDPQKLKRTTLAHCLPENAFHAQRGDVITNIYDLANCVESLSEAEFRQHVNKDGEYNHFADWVRSVLANGELARDLNYDMNLHDKEHYVKTIRDHIAWLESV